VSQENPIFSRLRLVGWRQFASVDISFHPQLTILTGANGAGKSTILNILSARLGVARPYLSVPQKLSTGITFFSGLSQIKKFAAGLLDWKRRSPDHFGELALTDGQINDLNVPKNTGPTYDLGVTNQVLGFHVPSHRLLPSYQRLGDTFSYSGIAPDQAFHTLINYSYSAFRGDGVSHSIIFYLKQILTAWRISGEGSAVMEPDPQQKQAYLGFVEILRKVLPAELGFEDIIIRVPDVLLKTRSGTFLIDAASGGLTTIIEIAAVIYACTLRPEIKGKRFSVTFDEPENHLHPALQRTLLPTLVATFPQAQFIVATHSPFMVSSLKDSNVYVLRHTDNERDADVKQLAEPERMVEAIKLDYANRAGTAGEILRDVLGVPVTLPSWVEKELNAIVRKYQSMPITADTVAALKIELSEAGIDDLFSEALSLMGRVK